MLKQLKVDWLETTGAENRDSIDDTLRGMIALDPVFAEPEGVTALILMDTATWPKESLSDLRRVGA